MSCCKLGLVVVNNSICPNELVVSVKLIDEGGRANALVFIGEYNLATNVVDVTAHHFLVDTIILLYDREVVNLGSVFFNDIEDLGLGGGYQ